MPTNLLNAKLHFRKMTNGNIFVQGVIPCNHNLDLFPLDKYNDSVGCVSIDINTKHLTDKTKEFAGKSNEVIIGEGF